MEAILISAIIVVVLLLIFYISNLVIKAKKIDKQVNVFANSEDGEKNLKINMEKIEQFKLLYFDVFDTELDLEIMTKDFSISFDKDPLNPMKIKPKDGAKVKVSEVEKKDESLAKASEKENKAVSNENADINKDNDMENDEELVTSVEDNKNNNEDMSIDQDKLEGYYHNVDLSSLTDEDFDEDVEEDTYTGSEFDVK